ncbi:MAG: acid protease [Flavobacteriaceae bacterium]|nr:acid protease [Flavobacteriaceae bacterium]
MQLRSFLSDKDFYRVPLQKLPTGHYKFRVKINNRIGNFILDTGASTSCIGFRDVEYFAIDSEQSEIKAAGAGAINMETRISRQNRIALNGKDMGVVDFVLFDLSHVNEALAQAAAAPVHGIMGADFLKRHRAVIDYGRNCLYLK